MENSYLIQRLCKPSKPCKLGGVEVKDNPFSFGGGFKNGGLSKEAMDLTRQIWSYDYMGAAEFEFGAVPEALNKMVMYARGADGGLIAGKMSVDGNVVYVICCANDMTEVHKRIVDIYNDRIRTEEWVGLKESFSKKDNFREVCGWIELANGFLFFSDRDMYIKARELFGKVIEVCDFVTV